MRKIKKNNWQDCNLRLEVHGTGSPFHLLEAKTARAIKISYSVMHQAIEYMLLIYIEESTIERVVMKRRWLRFVLLEDCCFADLLIKLSVAFNQQFLMRDDKGRYIAEVVFDNYKIKVVDKIDRLNEMLCDSNYTLDVVIDSDEYFNISFEAIIKNILRKHAIKWKRSIWAPLPLSSH
ncbi:hypothetical protein ACX122_01535 [Kosakonia cowanii]